MMATVIAASAMLFGAPKVCEPAPPAAQRMATGSSDTPITVMTVPVTTSGKKRSRLVKTGAMRNATVPATIRAPKTASSPSVPPFVGADRQDGRHGGERGALHDGLAGPDLPDPDGLQDGRQTGDEKACRDQVGDLCRRSAPGRCRRSAARRRHRHTCSARAGGRTGTSGGWEGSRRRGVSPSTVPRPARSWCSPLRVGLCTGAGAERCCGLRVASGRPAPGFRRQGPDAGRRRGWRRRGCARRTAPGRPRRRRRWTARALPGPRRRRLWAHTRPSGPR